MIDKSDMLRNLTFFNQPSKPFKHKKKTNFILFFIIYNSNIVWKFIVSNITNSALVNTCVCLWVNSELYKKLTSSKYVCL